MLAPMSLESNLPTEPATTVEHSFQGNERVQPLRLSQERFHTIIEHLRSSLPNEGCGLIAGIPVANEERAIHFFPGTNVDRSPVRFTMASKEVIESMWWMRTLGWRLAAIVHSHPRSAASPSPTDLREWYYPDARLFIVSFQHGEPEVGCWSLAGDAEAREFRRAPLVIGTR
jgi:proteasome lid subunit RPN8/RPN11